MRPRVGSGEHQWLTRPGESAHRPGGGVADLRLGVVVEVRADPRKVCEHVDLEAAQLLRGADARQQQQVGRADRARRQDDLAARACRSGLVADRVLDAEAGGIFDE